MSGKRRRRVPRGEPQGFRGHNPPGIIPRRANAHNITTRTRAHASQRKSAQPKQQHVADRSVAPGAWRVRAPSWRAPLLPCLATASRRRLLRVVRILRQSNPQCHHLPGSGTQQQSTPAATQPHMHTGTQARMQSLRRATPRHRARAGPAAGCVRAARWLHGSSCTRQPGCRTGKGAGLEAYIPRHC